ncbi:ABC-2 transporter permease [Amedibacillus sp. YH-ame10]
MKGLLIKDFQVLRTNRQLLIVVLAMFVFFGLTQEGANVFMVSYVTVVSGMLVMSTISYDELDHGYSFLFTLPITRSLYVREKYLFGCILSFSGWLLSSLVSTGLYMARSSVINWSQWGFTLGAFIFIIFILLSVMLPVQLKFGGEKGRIALIGMIAGAFAVGALVITAAKYFNIDFTSLYQMVESMGSLGIVAVMVVVTLAIVAVSYRISLNIMNKKQF